MTAAHRDPRLIVLVGLGGAAGAFCRWGVGTLLQQHGTATFVPVGTLVVNLVGAFCLGLLLESLLLCGPDEGGRRLLRLGLGTGFLGAFTTWSSLAVETAEQLARGQTGAGVGYLVGSVLCGVVTAWCGLRVARSWPRSPMGGE